MSGPRIVVTPPGPRSRELLDRAGAVLYPGTGHGLIPAVVARKQGHEVEDVDGNVFVDLISASASVPLGACRADIVDDAVEALRRYGNEDSHTMVNELTVRLAERLLEIAPPGLTRVDLALNGTEAVETAIKLMRRSTGRPVVIGFFSQYHGESTTTAALGAEQSDISRGSAHIRPGVLPRRPTRTRTARRWRRRGRAAPATRRWTTCATTCCSMRCTRTRWRA